MASAAELDPHCCPLALCLAQQEFQFTRCYVLGCHRVEGLLKSKELKDLIYRVPLGKRWARAAKEQQESTMERTLVTACASLTAARFA